MDRYWLRRAFHPRTSFLATLLVVTTAVAIFAGANFAGEVSAEKQIDHSLSQLPSDFTVGTGRLLNSNGYRNMTTIIRQVKGVDSAELRSLSYFRGNVSGVRDRFALFGIPDDSIIYSGISLQSGVSRIASDEVYVWSGSTNASVVHLGDSIDANFTYFINSTKTVRFVKSLRVAGTVTINQLALSELTDSILGESLISSNLFAGTVLLASWNSTFSSLVDAVALQGVVPDPFSTRILIYAKTSAFDATDLSSSLIKAESLSTQIGLAVSPFGAGVSGEWLVQALQSGEHFIETFRLIFVGVAVPIMLIAWYLVSSMFFLSFKIRRKDNALLIVRGFPASRLLAMSWFEASLIAFSGTVSGIFLGAAIVSSVSGSSLERWSSFSTQSILYSLAFGVVSTFLLSIRPAQRVLKVPVVDSLNQREELGTRKRSMLSNRLWACAVFVTLLEVAVGPASVGASFLSGGSFITPLIAQLWNSLIVPFAFVAPFVLLLGVTKLLVNTSALERFSHGFLRPLMGGLADVATKSFVRGHGGILRFILLFGLISTYLVLSSGFVTSQSNFQSRQAEFTVGSDLAVSVTPLPNETMARSRATAIAGTLKSWNELSSITVVYGASITWDGDVTLVKVIDPSTWLKTSYYEDEWFSPQSTNNLFQEMQSDNRSIILTKDLSQAVTVATGNDPLGSTLPFRITFSGQTVSVNLKVIGLFGPLSTRPGVQASELSWSYVSTALFGASNPSILAETVLLRVASGYDPTVLERKIASEFAGVQVVSAAEVKLTVLTDPQTSAVGTLFGLGLFLVGGGTLVGLAAFFLDRMSLEDENNRLLTLKGFSCLQVRVAAIAGFLPGIILFMLLGIGVGYAALVGVVQILDLSQAGFVTLKPVLGQFSLFVVVSYMILLVAAVTGLAFLKIRTEN